MIKQAIIPLAGLGTRLLPLTSIFAKELLPINGKPGLEYIIQECIELLKRDDLKYQLKMFLEPIINMIFNSTFKHKFS